MWSELDSKDESEGIIVEENGWCFYFKKQSDWQSSYLKQKRNSCREGWRKWEDNEVWLGYIEFAAPKGHFHEIEDLEKDMGCRYRFVVRHNSPSKIVSILKYTATPSPRHPATLLVLLVSPDFSKAPDSHPVCHTFSLGQFRFLWQYFTYVSYLSLRQQSLRHY